MKILDKAKSLAISNQEKNIAYEIVELDIQEDELSDYVIAKVNGYEEVLKKIHAKTIRKIIGSVNRRDDQSNSFPLKP